MDKKVNAEISMQNAVLAFIQNRETVKVREIGKYFNITDERAVRRIVEKLREKGEPICIGTKGYYYSTDPAEIERTITQLVSQARGQIRTAKALKLAKEKLEAMAQ